MRLDNELAASPHDPRDQIATFDPVGEFAPYVDLKPYSDEVENQLQYGSCTANAACSALELMYKQNGKEFDFSRFFAYYYFRKLSAITGDEGAYPRNIGKALKKYGVCYESTWQYIPDNLDKVPPPEVQQEASVFLINNYQSIQGDKLNEIKKSLMNGIPVLLCMELHTRFMSLRGDWKVQKWDWVPSETNKSVGLHEVLIIGYDDDAKRLLCENSWGPTWGDGGYFGTPYEFINTDSFGELWVLNPNYDLNTELMNEFNPYTINTDAINDGLISTFIRKLIEWIKNLFN